MDDGYQWVPFYEELAEKLLAYKDRREELFDVMQAVASQEPMMKYLGLEPREVAEGHHAHVDPFTIMAVINRGMTYENRTALARVLAQAFDVDSPVPTQFVGIPVRNPVKAIYGEPDLIWTLFICAMDVAQTGVFSAEFTMAFDKAVAAFNNGVPSITMALYWVRPNFFMPLDGNSHDYIRDHYGIAVPAKTCSGEEYVKFLGSLKKELLQQDPGVSLPQVSQAAWVVANLKSHSETQGSHEGTRDVPKTTDHGTTFDKNLILYGPPGTGKTYNTVFYAVSIIEDEPLAAIQAEGYETVFKRYLGYKDDGLIAFTTFHQSFGYEEFIEGIRPVVSEEESAETGRDIVYEVHDGIFKSFCDKAGTPIGGGTGADLGLGKNPVVWKVSLQGTGDNPTRTDCMENNHIRIGWDSYGETISDATDFSTHGGRRELNAFYGRMQVGDIVFSCYSSKTIDGIGVITGEPEWHDEYPQYKRLRAVRWFARGINEDIVDLNAGKTMTLPSVYQLSVSASDALQLLKEVEPSLFPDEVRIPNRVFIIDEINRGNISKIFGELITLIEPTKRIGASEELRALLPYSGKNFGVPDNVYLIGTMNTADRSIALIDTALRRRFSFVELQPDSTTLKDLSVDGRDVAQMLGTLNKRITVLLDREHTIGHSYLLPLRDDPTLDTLASIFRNKIVPLLQEYFYDDYEKIQLVLGDNQKLDADGNPDDSIRFIITKTDAVTWFGDTEVDVPDYYEINNDAFARIESYAFL